ncbi:PmbA protein [Desulfohalotomaculum tongense]|uniref:TldD/PmbA family protein n=1 Tax=Desulforadius tongensis TaxID=1216062 RepID=UPI0019564ED9|nr:TldD/PmbA family protein [Desulforadius tongensis]MBM7855471.1 PmbA protein [Desulforadius tongensis]
MGENLLSAAESAIASAGKSGVSMAEAYIARSKELSIEVRSGEVETMKLAEDRGIGLRLIKDGRVGFAYSTELTVDGVNELVRQALANAGSAERDENICLPDPAARYPQLDLYDPDIKSAPVEEKIKLAVTMEQQARAYDSRVKIIESSSYQDGEAEIIIVNSKGIKAGYRGAYSGLYIALVAGEGDDSQTGFAFEYGLKYKELDPAGVGKLAARRAVRMLGAKPVPTQNVPVVLDPYIVTNFLGLLGPALTAEAVQKGRSLFAGKVGQEVASQHVTIVDDGSRPGGIASAPFDGEGVPSSKTVLIRDGRLQGYLHNTYTAAKDGVQSTGNGVRNSFKSTPEVGTTNFYIEPGTVSHEDIIKDIDKGLYITEVMGMHTANPISGDFSLGAAGMWIEKGEFTKPVRGVAIAGNVMELLKSVDAVGSDLCFYGSKGAPTVRVARMTVSGK